MLTPLCGHELLFFIFYVVIVVGFLTNGTSVIEGQSFNVCVAVTNPPQQIPMLLSFDIKLNILPVTAGEQLAPPCIT